MNNNSKVIIIVVIVILIGLVIYFNHKRSDKEVLVPTQEPIVGCYVDHLGQDVYTLKIISQEFGNFNGTLSFKNFEKDSSSGSYIGTYNDGILLGEYSFRSEGMDSVRQVIFKKSGNSFIEGFGEYDEAGDHFKDLDKISFDSNSTFVLSESCE